jgi:hypothetical protein
MNRGLTFGAVLGIGTGVMYLLDPESRKETTRAFARQARPGSHAVGTRLSHAGNLELEIILGETCAGICEKLLMEVNGCCQFRQSAL